LPLLRYPSDENFPQLLAINFDRSLDGELIGNEDYLRIGDFAATVPPYRISLTDVSNNHVEPVPRTTGGIVMSTGFVEKIVQIEFEVTSAYDVFGLSTGEVDPNPDNRRVSGGYLSSPPIDNRSIASLIAQFKRTPILPVTNTYLNSNGVHVLALERLFLRAGTKDGQQIPNALAVVLWCKALEIGTFCSSIPPYQFDSAFIYPLQRWYWQQAYAEWLPGQWRVCAKWPDLPSSAPLTTSEQQTFNGLTASQPYLISTREPFDAMSAQFQFTVVDSAWLKGLSDLHDQYNRWQTYALSDAVKILPQSEKLSIYEALENLLAEITNFTDDAKARMRPWDTPDLIMTGISAEINNSFVMVRSPANETPGYQHMGGGEVRFTVTFTALTLAALDSVRAMVEYARTNAREARYELVAGFVGFENEIASLMGVHNVVFTNIVSEPVEGYPNIFTVAIEMISFERHQRRIEAVKGAALLPQLINEQLPSGVSGEVGPISAGTDPRYVFWQRYINDYNPAKDPRQPTGDKGNNGFDTTGRPVNAWFAAAPIQEAKEQMAYLELYPDLELPTFERIQAALQNGEIFDPSQLGEAQAQLAMQQLRWEYWTDQGRFVDPDFYIDYPNELLAEKLNIPINPLGAATSSYLAQVASQISTLNQNGTIALNITGSVSEAVRQSLFDEHPAGGLYGVDPQAMGATAPEAAPGSDNTNQGRPSTAWESGPQRGHTNLVGSLTMPTINNGTQTATNQFTPTVTQQSNYQATLQVDGQSVQITHPGENSYGVNAGNYGTASWLKIPGLPAAVQDSAQEILGQKKDGKDPRAYLNQALQSHHPVDVGSQQIDEHGRMIAMLRDLMEHDMTGRLVQAYPTYVFQLMDEGPKIGWQNLMPNLYALQAIQSIDIINDRRDPMHTAIIEIMNTYGNLSSYTQFQLSANMLSALYNYNGDTIPVLSNLGTAALSVAKGAVSFNMGEVFAATDDIRNNINRWVEGFVNPIRLLLGTDSVVQQQIEQRKKQQGQVMLAPGVRVHIRMGYGSNGAKFPVLFNGRIAEVGLGERVQIIAVGDGIELTKLIPSAESETNSINRPDRGFLPGLLADGNRLVHGQAPTGEMMDLTYEPREIIGQMLNSHGEELYDYSLGTKFWNLIKHDIYSASQGGAWAENPIGISHFGNPYLFQFWDAIGDNGPEGIDVLDPDTHVINQPQQISAYRKVAPFTNPSKTLTDYVYQASLAGINFLTGGLLEAGLTTAAGVAGAAGQPKLAETYKVAGIAAALVGNTANMLNQGIPSGYGETCENVYSIYTPFSKFFREVGSFSSAVGVNYFAQQAAGVIANPYSVKTAIDNVQAKAAQGGFNPSSGQFDAPPLPDVGQTQLMGPHPPGITFNMYTKNKTCWDVISTMAQYFPPYVAAVVPFEYRSTLFFGAPYYQFRYDYQRVSAYDLGQADPGLDRFYGYPVGYKTKTFCQFHYYGSTSNLLTNTIRASDEETYTDVIAMWYNGQGYQSSRPTPKPVHQTVDRQISSAFRKTAIVNTDVLGLDVAPTKAAIIGSLGLDLVGYWAENIGIPGTDFSIAGGMGHWITEENMRQMARAILRDYQKLMYQGQVLVLGDPTVKPYDIMYLNDTYTDVRGLCGVRKVTHHFGFDVGYVTSIEPDMLCEVKGENYWSSMWAWFGGYLAADVVSLLGAKWALCQGTKQFSQSLFNFGVKVTKQNITQRIFSFLKGGSKPPPTGYELKIGGKAVSTFKPRFLTYQIRNLILDGLNRVLSGSTSVSTSVQSSFGTTASEYQQLAQNISNAVSKTRSIFGKTGVEKVSGETAAQIINEVLAEAIDENGEEILDAAIKDAIAKNFLNFTNGTFDQAVNRTAAEVIAKRGVLNFLTRESTTLTSKTLAGAGADLTEILADAFGQVGEKSIQAVVTEDLAVAGGRLAGLAAELFPILMEARIISCFNPIGLAANVIFQIIFGYAWTAISRYWDDQTSLVMVFLKYRGAELQAGLNGHSESVVLQAALPGDTSLTISDADKEKLRQLGAIQPRGDMVHATLAKGLETASPAQSVIVAPVAGIAVPTESGSVANPVTFLSGGTSYSTSSRMAIISKHQWESSLIMTELLTQQTAPPSQGVSNDIISFLNFLTQNGISVYMTAAAARSHGDLGAGTGSYHYKGQAIDIGLVSENGGPMINVAATPPAGLRLIRLAERYNVAQIGVNSYYDAGQLAELTTPAGTDVGDGTIMFIDRGTGAHIHIATRT
jgi:hypothetical protein